MTKENPHILNRKTTSPRDRKIEKHAATIKKQIRLENLIDARNTGKIGDEVIKIPQAMLLCTLPYSNTREKNIKRTARLGNGTPLVVTFSAGIPDVPIPFGADRKLLNWLLDRAIRSGSHIINWSSAWKYQEEMGFKRSGKNNRDLRKRFHRISGLNINVERACASCKDGKSFSLIDDYRLPTSITGKKVTCSQDKSDRANEGLVLPHDPFFISINRTFYDDIREYYVAIPRALWLQVKGNFQIQDIILWLYYRCYAARTESVIPWSALTEQFPQDKNSRRTRQHVREAIVQLRLIWPGVQVDLIRTGIVVNNAAHSLLPDDPTRGRTRRLAS